MINDARKRAYDQLRELVASETVQLGLIREALLEGDWSRAAMRIYKTRWAQENGERADQLARVFLTGKDQE